MPALDANPNMQLMTNAEVEFLLYSKKGQATGVSLKSDGSEKFLNPGGKIVLTAGVFHTPRILMMSGGNYNSGRSALWENHMQILLPMLGFYERTCDWKKPTTINCGNSS